MARKPGIAHIDVQIKGDVVGKVRDAGGRYIARDTRALKQEFMELAHRAQAEVISRMSTSYVRPMAVTGRLERATADRRNRVYTDQGFGVGVERWLDRSEAKYWRTIEEGSRKAWSRGGMAGMELHGKFGAAFDWAEDGRGGRRARATAPWSINGRPIEGGYFAWFRKMPAIIVKKEIEPMHAYQRAYSESGVFNREPAAYVMEFVRQVARATLAGE